MTSAGVDEPFGRRPRRRSRLPALHDLAPVTALAGVAALGVALVVGPTTSRAMQSLVRDPVIAVPGPPVPRPVVVSSRLPPRRGRVSPQPAPPEGAGAPLAATGSRTSARPTTDVARLPDVPLLGLVPRLTTVASAVSGGGGVAAGPGGPGGVGAAGVLADQPAPALAAGLGHPGVTAGEGGGGATGGDGGGAATAGVTDEGLAAAGGQRLEFGGEEGVTEVAPAGAAAVEGNQEAHGAERGRPRDRSDARSSERAAKAGSAGVSRQPRRGGGASRAAAGPRPTTAGKSEKAKQSEPQRRQSEPQRRQDRGGHRTPGGPGEGAHQGHGHGRR